MATRWLWRKLLERETQRLNYCKFTLKLQFPLWNGTEKAVASYTVQSKWVEQQQQQYKSNRRNPCKSLSFDLSNSSSERQQADICCCCCSCWCWCWCGNSYWWRSLLLLLLLFVVVAFEKTWRHKNANVSRRQQKRAFSSALHCVQLYLQHLYTSTSASLLPLFLLSSPTQMCAILHFLSTAASEGRSWRSKATIRLNCGVLAVCCTSTQVSCLCVCVYWKSYRSEQSRERMQSHNTHTRTHSHTSENERLLPGTNGCS